VNINHTPWDSIATILNLNQANLIVQQRQVRPFSSWDDMMTRVRGLGAEKIEKAHHGW